MRVPRRATGLVLTCALLTGCYTPRIIPVVPLPVRLRSPTEFRLVQPAGPDWAALSCRALRAEVHVSALHGDTLHFSRATVLAQATGAAPCTTMGAGFLVVAEHPDLRAEKLAFNGGLTAAATVGLLVALPLVGGFLLVLLWSGT